MRGYLSLGFKSTFIEKHATIKLLVKSEITEVWITTEMEILENISVGS